MAGGGHCIPDSAARTKSGRTTCSVAASDKTAVRERIPLSRISSASPLAVAKTGTSIGSTPSGSCTCESQTRVTSIYLTLKVAGLGRHWYLHEP